MDEDLSASSAHALFKQMLILDKGVLAQPATDPPTSEMIIRYSNLDNIKSDSEETYMFTKDHVPIVNSPSLRCFNLPTTFPYWENPR